MKTRRQEGIISSESIDRTRLAEKSEVVQSLRSVQTIVTRGGGSLCSFKGQFYSGCSAGFRVVILFAPFAVVLVPALRALVCRYRGLTSWSSTAIRTGMQIASSRDRGWVAVSSILPMISTAIKQGVPLVLGFCVSWL
jgi:hypothetical protein